MKTIDSKIYGNILAEFQPRIVKTEEENQKYLAEVEKLMGLGDDITSEQEELLKLLVALIEQFEDQYYQLK
jgi:HTH-type transcriptional regulator/antitoxin HigA